MIDRVIYAVKEVSLASVPAESPHSTTGNTQCIDFWVIIVYIVQGG